jgi:aryl-phospho-beta-D-glucosidase BglC (GH1 family)
VYSAHELSQDAFNQTWFSSPTYPANLRALWRSRWGYLAENSKSPIFVGCFGTYFVNAVKDDQWLTQLVNYMNGQFTSDGVSDLKAGQMGLSWSVGLQDIGILFRNDYKTVDTRTMSYLKSSLGSLLSGPVPSAKPTMMPTFFPSARPTTASPSTRRPTFTVTIHPTNILANGKQFTIYSTRGNQIVDEDGNSVRLTGVNWYGFETDNFIPFGLLARRYTDILDRIKQLGFNVLRLPFSNQALLPASKPRDIDYGKNYDLAGLNTLQCLDKFIQYSGVIGLRVILDRHSAEAGMFYNETFWHVNSFYTEQRYIDDWVMLAKRYGGTSVIAADLWNEPKNKATWGFNNKTDWNLAAERVSTAIQEVNPDWLIIVEGIGIEYWWGGNLKGVAKHPLRIPFQNKLVYSVHEYCVELYPQQWFVNASYPGGTFPGNMRGVWDSNWGYILRQNIAPIFVGEFGTDFLHEPYNSIWLPMFLKYINGEYTNDTVSDLMPGDFGASWAWWAINPDLQDYSLFTSDWNTVVEKKMNAIKPYLGPPLK